MSDLDEPASRTIEDVGVGFHARRYHEHDEVDLHIEISHANARYFVGGHEVGAVIYRDALATMRLTFAQTLADACDHISWDAVDAMIGAGPGPRH